MRALAPENEKPQARLVDYYLKIEKNECDKCCTSEKKIKVINASIKLLI